MQWQLEINGVLCKSDQYNIFLKFCPGLFKTYNIIEDEKGLQIEKKRNVKTTKQASDLSFNRLNFCMCTFILLLG